MSIQSLLRGVSVAASVMVAATAACADEAADWPSRTIEIVIPNGPGGPTDILARNLAREAASARAGWDEEGGAAATVDGLP